MRTIKTKIEDLEWAIDVYDTDATPLSKILKADILWACIWKNYYLFQTNRNDPYDAQVYLVDKNTKTVEWGYKTSLVVLAGLEGQSITSEELKRALA